MLELKDYNRKELIDIYKTERLDAIKAKIKRQGYLYLESGRGKNYIMKITKLPKEQEFKRYCVDVLGFNESVQTDKLKVFLSNLLTNDGFAKLQINEMCEIIKEQGNIITEATVRKYLKQINSIGIIEKPPQDYVYYVYDKKTQHNKYITSEEYKEMYRQYWNTIAETKNFDKAEAEIKEKYGNKPKKRLAYQINGIYKDYIEELENLLKE